MMRMIPFCVKCGREFRNNEIFYHSSIYRRWPLPVRQYICQQCSKGENMVQTKQLKITAEVDGKQIPLKTVSTETFEAIKALEESKEIMTSVAAIGHYKDEPKNKRLFLKINESLRKAITIADTYTIAIDLRDGYVSNYWSEDNPQRKILDNLYENVQPL